MNKNEFMDHVVWDKINLISESSKDERIDLATQDFIINSVNYIENRLKIALIEITNEAELQSLTTELDNTTNQINSFLGNNNVGHLTNAMNNLFSAMNRLRNFPTPINKNSYNYSKSINSFKNNYIEKNNILEEKYTQLNIKYQESKKLIDESLLNIEQLENKINEKDTEIDELNQTFYTEFESVKEETKNFKDDFFKVQKEFFDNQIIDYEERIKLLENEIIEKSDKILLLLNNKNEEAIRLVGLVADSAITGNYQRIANENKISANRLRNTALALMAILSVLLVYAVWDISSTNFDWKRSLIRIIAAAALSYPATYAARESSKHRKIEIRNRRIELELASINPFIEFLEDANKKSIKEELVGKYFGNDTNDLSVDDKNDEVSLNLIERLVKTILPILNK
ncbi:hypothetical protein [Oceanispirochaeta sp. M2]|nr:hypothetical protein [Oceanispirochaeta sp. M2]MBF9019039.1 hypothetical protein [Oceanispirochaeta sp. M2]